MNKNKNITSNADDLPTEFETKSRCLIISNEWQELNAHVHALNDRGIVIHFDPTNFEIHRRVREWFDDDEVYEFIGKYLAFIRHLSMRDYVEASKVKNAKKVKIDWKQALHNHWKLDEKIVAVVNLLEDKNLSQNERVERFCRITGGSRATFFRTLQEVKRIMGNNETLTLATPEKVSKSQGSGNGQHAPGDQIGGDQTEGAQPLGNAITKQFDPSARYLPPAK